LCGVRVRVCGCVWHFNSVFLVVVGAFQRGLMQSIHKAWPDAKHSQGTSSVTSSNIISPVSLCPPTCPAQAPLTGVYRCFPGLLILHRGALSGICWFGETRSSCVWDAHLNHLCTARDVALSRHNASLCPPDHATERVVPAAIAVQPARAGDAGPPAAAQQPCGRPASARRAPSTRITVLGHAVSTEMSALDQSAPPMWLCLLALPANSSAALCSALPRMLVQRLPACVAWRGGCAVLQLALSLPHLAPGPRCHSVRPRAAAARAAQQPPSSSASRSSGHGSGAPRSQARR